MLTSIVLATVLAAAEPPKEPPPKRWMDSCTADSDCPKGTACVKPKDKKVGSCFHKPAKKKA